MDFGDNGKSLSHKHVQADQKVSTSWYWNLYLFDQEAHGQSMAQTRENPWSKRAKCCTSHIRIDGVAVASSEAVDKDSHAA